MLPVGAQLMIPAVTKLPFDEYVSQLTVNNCNKVVQDILLLFRSTGYEDEKMHAYLFHPLFAVEKALRSLTNGKQSACTVVTVTPIAF